MAGRAEHLPRKAAQVECIAWREREVVVEAVALLAKVSLKGIYDLGPLNAILTKAGKAKVVGS